MNPELYNYKSPLKKKLKKVLSYFLGNKLALALAAFFTVFVFVLVPVELYFWNANDKFWVCKFCIFDSELGWKTVSNANHSKNKIDYKTNSYGFRSDDVDSSKEHILILGDSVAFGTGVTDNDTFPSLLNKRFKNRYQVLNLSVPGYGIDQYLLSLKRYVGKLNPKIIIVVIYTGDDWANTTQDNLFGTSKPYFKLRNGELFNLVPKISEFSCGNIISKIRSTRHLLSPSIKKKICGFRKLAPIESIPLILELLNQLNQTSLALKSKLLFVLSPRLKAVQTVGCKSRGLNHPCNSISKGFEYYHIFFKNALEKGRLHYIDHLKNLALLDDAKLKANFFDNHHYSPLGHRFLAKFIYKELTTL